MAEGTAEFKGGGMLSSCGQDSSGACGITTGMGMVWRKGLWWARAQKGWEEGTRGGVPAAGQQKN